jgi:glutathione S-transferase
MRLFIASASPFVRKCRIVAREKGVLDQMEEVTADPYANDPDLVAANPIAQIPALVLDDGTVFTDSPVIAAVLDDLGAGGRLVPQNSEKAWEVRRLETLANGVLEMAVKLVLEGRRPENERSPTWIQRWTDNMGRALDALEAWDVQADPLDMGVITTGVALTYLDFRHPNYDWKTGRPNLVALQKALEQRQSFKETYPR